MRALRRLLLALPPLATLALTLASAMSGCHSDEGVLRAKVIENRSEVVGGPVAVADVGDFLLENDQMRVAILAPRDSPGPGVYGGSIVDIDRRRPQLGFEGGLGRDRFAESFPVANLLVPAPESLQVRVIADGSDGQEAVVRVEGEGEFLFEALSVLRNQEGLLESLFPNIATRIRFVTDYVLRPGARHMIMRTTLRLPEEISETCPALAGCDLSCDNGKAAGPDGCLVCACSGVLPLDIYGAPQSVFGGILGDSPENDPQPPDPKRAGIIAGDFVFFGNQNDVFAPGPGFDEDYAVQDAYNTGRNTFQEPLVYDFVAAAGGDISYGYFTRAANPADPVATNVPLFASAATAFLAAGKNCRVATDDDDECDAFRAFSYERYIVVGDGDIASVTAEMRRVRGTPTGRVSGHVHWAETGESVPNARLFVFLDPDPGAELATVTDLAEANLRARADVGLVDAIDADLGLDPQEDGDFSAELAPGAYRVVAQNAEGTAVSAPQRLQVVAGGAHQLAPVLPSPARVRYRIVDEAGNLLSAKLALVALDAGGNALEGDGTRRVYMGDGRLGNGVRTIELTASGNGVFEAEPGRYLLRVSRGPEYGIVERDVTLLPGREETIEAQLLREMDTSGWMSADMHLHAQPSFDSGMPLSRRVRTVAAEGVELGVSTDHDVESDYRPEMNAAALEPRFVQAIGAEITTLEQGHFIGFPLDYDALLVPDHGAHDWTCEPGGEILDAIRESGDRELAPDGPLTIVAHPRDGFFGYADQLGVDGYTMNRTVPFLEAQNPVFRTASCNFDASEVIAAKRNDLTRTPSVIEVTDYNRCLARLEAAPDLETLTGFCPELGGDGLLAPCRDNERYAVCRDRNRTRLAWVTTARILSRTPEEQDANWDFAGDEAASEELCDPLILGDLPVPEATRDAPCSFRTGQVDDWFRWLERGLRPTQIGSSDSHNLSKEPGFPRTWFRSATDSPEALTIADAVTSLRAGHALASYGPFVRASIDGKTFGEVVQTNIGREVEMTLDVATASWFGVDRVEIYVNGRIDRVLRPNEGKAALLDVRGKVTLEVPDRDSWVVIIAMGLDDENTMRPVSLDVPYGEVQLSVLAARAFGLIDSPTIQSVFPAEPVVPDWSPIFAYAVTNPIYLDVDGNGAYDPPLPFPDWCSAPCDPEAADDPCPTGQTCLEKERVCGVQIGGVCDHRRPAAHHQD